MSSRNEILLYADGMMSCRTVRISTRRRGSAQPQPHDVVLEFRSQEDHPSTLTSEISTILHRVLVVLFLPDVSRTVIGSLPTKAYLRHSQSAQSCESCALGLVVARRRGSLSRCESWSIPGTRCFMEILSAQCPRSRLSGCLGG